MIRQIVLCGRIVNYDLQIKNVKNINLRIRIDGSIQVSANRKTSIEKIEAFIRSKEEWIIGALNKIERRNEEIAKREKENEGRILLWGEEINLFVVEGKINSYKYSEGKLEISLKNICDTKAREAIISEFYKNECKLKFTSLCQRAYEVFSIRGLEFPEIKYRRMKSRWGSCNIKKGVLTFNTILATMPPDCAEYVVFHEFSHFLHPNHSKAFYECLSAHMPDWKQRKQLLRERGDTL